MKKFIEEQVEAYAAAYTQAESNLLKELQAETERTMAQAQMLVGPLEGQFLKMLVLISKAVNILEIGTFTGYSALSMAEALPANGKLITCELSAKHAAFATRYFEKSPHGKKITLKLGPALESIAKLQQSFDLVFIDADKENYRAYYEAALPLLPSGGLIVLDNCLYSGWVVRPCDSASAAIHELNELVSRDERVENVITTIRDGLNIIRKK